MSEEERYVWMQQVERIQQTAARKAFRKWSEIIARRFLLQGVWLDIVKRRAEVKPDHIVEGK